MNSQPSTPIVQLGLTRQQVLHSRPLDEHLVVTLKCDHSQNNNTVAVIVAVDTSGSMAMPAAGRHSKLELVMLSLKHLAGELSPTDHLALIAFNGTATVLCENAKANSDGKAAFRAALGSMRASGNTNIEHAIRAALALAAEHEPRTQVRIILLTDGQANAGMTDRHHLTAVASERADNVTISTIGVGDDCDHGLLGDLAEIGQGGYAFVEHEADVARVIGAELGSFLETGANNVIVNVTGGNNVTAHCAEPGTISTPDGVRVKLGTLRTGAEKAVVVRLTGPATAKAHVRPVTVATVNVEYTTDGTPGMETATIKILRGKENGQTDPHAAEAVARSELAELTRRARELAAQGDYSGAAAALRSAELPEALGVLANEIAHGYETERERNEQAASSAYTLLRGRALNGASARFAATAMNSVGSWMSDSQRHYGAAIANRVSGEIEPDSASMNLAATPRLKPPIAGAVTTSSGHWQVAQTGDGVGGEEDADRA